MRGENAGEDVYRDVFLKNVLVLNEIDNYKRTHFCSVGFDNIINEGTLNI
jgi:hypothetical protein